MSQSTVYSLEALNKVNSKLGSNNNTRLTVSENCFVKQKLLESLITARSYATNGSQALDVKQMEKLKFISFLIDLAELEAHGLPNDHEEPISSRNQAP